MSMRLQNIIKRIAHLRKYLLYLLMRMMVHYVHLWLYSYTATCTFSSLKNKLLTLGDQLIRYIVYSEDEEIAAKLVYRCRRLFLSSLNHRLAAAAISYTNQCQINMFHVSMTTSLYFPSKVLSSLGWLNDGLVQLESKPTQFWSVTITVIWKHLPIFHCSGYGDPLW